MYKFILNTLIWILFIWILFGTAYYTWILTSLTAQITVVNSKFLVYIPIEYRIILMLLFFVLIYIFILNFKD